MKTGQDRLRDAGEVMGPLSIGMGDNEAGMNVLGTAWIQRA